MAERRPPSEAGRPPTREEASSLAEAYVAAYNDRDLEAMIAVLDESIVSHPSKLGGARKHEGHAGVRAWWEAMASNEQWYEVLIREIRQISRDQVAILGEIQDRGEPISPWCAVIRIGNGLITESHSYLSEADLLDELGLITE